MKKVGHPITLEDGLVLEKNFFSKSCRLTPETYRGGTWRVWKGPVRVWEGPEGEFEKCRPSHHTSGMGWT